MQPVLDNAEAVGQYLREIRESLGIPMRQVSDHLHIRVRYLEAMEQGQFHLLPGSAYIRGYLIKYADYLGIAPQVLFPAQMPQDAAPIEAKHATPAPVASASQNGNGFFIPTASTRPRTPRSLWVGMALMVALLSYALWSGVHRDELVAPMSTSEEKQKEAASRPLPPEMPADYQASIPQVYALDGCENRFNIEPEIICYWVRRSTQFGLQPVRQFGALISWRRMDFAL